MLGIGASMGDLGGPAVDVPKSSVSNPGYALSSRQRPRHGENERHRLHVGRNYAREAWR
jgi:hypothetical protein